MPTPHFGSSVTSLLRVRDSFRFAAWTSPLLAAALGAALSLVPLRLDAQRVVRQPEQVVSVSKGASVLVITQTPLQRFSVGDPNVAEAVVVSPTEVLVNGKNLGTTTLVLWDNANAPRLYSIEVTADAPGMERYLRLLMPDEQITVTATGNSVTLSGQVRDASSANRAVEIARGSGATIIDNMGTPDRRPGAAPGPVRRGEPQRRQELQLAVHYPQPPSAQRRRRLARRNQRPDGRDRSPGRPRLWPLQS